MEPIEINYNIRDLKHQLTFLIKQEFHITYHRYKKNLYYFIGWTLLVLALSTLTDSESSIILKGVLVSLTAIVWAVVLILLLTVFVRWQRRMQWRKTSIKYFKEKDLKAYITFDSEKLIFITDNYKTEFKWDYYTFYAEDKGSIFLFPQENVYGAIYFSSSEIGNENWERLKAISKSKLTPIK